MSEQYELRYERDDGEFRAVSVVAASPEHARELVEAPGLLEEEGYKLVAISEPNREGPT